MPPSSSVVAAVDAPYCDAKPKTPHAASEEIALLPASETRLCTVELVQWPAELAFDLLRISAHPSESGQDEDLPLTLAFCSAALERGQPLLVLFDLRDGRTPPSGRARASSTPSSSGPQRMRGSGMGRCRAWPSSCPAKSCAPSST